MKIYDTTSPLSGRHHYSVARSNGCKTGSALRWYFCIPPGLVMVYSEGSRCRTLTFIDGKCQLVGRELLLALSRKGSERIQYGTYMPMSPQVSRGRLMRSIRTAGIPTIIPCRTGWYARAARTSSSAHFSKILDVTCFAPLQRTVPISCAILHRVLQTVSLRSATAL